MCKGDMYTRMAKHAVSMALPAHVRKHIPPTTNMCATSSKNQYVLQRLVCAPEFSPPGASCFRTKHPGLGICRQEHDGQKLHSKFAVQ